MPTEHEETNGNIEDTGAVEPEDAQPDQGADSPEEPDIVAVLDAQTETIERQSKQIAALKAQMAMLVHGGAVVGGGDDEPPAAPEPQNERQQYVPLRDLDFNMSHIDE